MTKPYFRIEQTTKGVNAMNRLLGFTLLAVVLTACATQSAHAGYCGAASFKLCSACCEDTCTATQSCCTVMKTCKEVVYEKQQYTCYKTVCEPVTECKTI